MLTLGPAMIVNVYPTWAELRSLATTERWSLRAEDLPLVERLAVGVPESQTADLRGLDAAVENGWAVEAADTFDPFLAERLEILNRRYAWCTPDIPEAAREVMARAHASRRVFHRGFGQFAALPETVARRVALAGEAPKRILVIGDDDFLSLGLAAAGHDVTVLEIDPSILALIERLRAQGQRITVVSRDAREPWPEELRGFDLLFTDPLTGPYALRLFINRGLAALADGGTGYVCVAEVGLHSFEAIRRACDFDLIDHYSDFNHYYGPFFELAHYVSDLTVLRANARTVLDPPPDDFFYSPGLSFEERYTFTPASTYLFQNIDPTLTQLIHLDTALQVLKASGQLDVLSEQMHHEEKFRCWVGITRQGHAIHVRIDPERRLAELFVSPADPPLEDSFMACLFGLFKVEGTVVQKHRLRSSSLLRLI